MPVSYVNSSRETQGGALLKCGGGDGELVGVMEKF